MHELEDITRPVSSLFNLSGSGCVDLAFYLYECYPERIQMNQEREMTKIHSLTLRICRVVRERNSMHEAKGPIKNIKLAVEE